MQTISEQTQVTILGKVVGVYRQCVHCDEWKLLEHFLMMKNGSRYVRASVRVCAACRPKFGPPNSD